jgi:hypothetical protein
MMARPVAHYLMRFGNEVAATDQADEKTDFAPAALWSPELQQQQQQESAKDRLLEIETSRENGRSEGEAAAREEFAVELEKVRQLHQSELAAARLTWVKGEGAALRASLAAGLAEIEERLAQALGRVLSHFVIDALRNRMMTELVETIEVMIGGDEALPIKVSGPADLLEALHNALSETRPNITYEVTENVDVVVRAGETSIETQLSTWVARIKVEME